MNTSSSTLLLIFTFDIYIKYNFADYHFTFSFSGFRVASFAAPFNSLVWMLMWTPQAQNCPAMQRFKYAQWAKNLEPDYFGLCIMCT